MRGMFAAAAIATLGAVSLPASAQKADDYILTCDDPSKPGAPYSRPCGDVQAQFKKEFPLAMRGNYQAQRNVAFVLGGRDGPTPVKTSMIAACAWRLVIIASGSPEVWSGDASNVKIDCGKLDETERAAAQAQASALIAKIGRR